MVKVSLKPKVDEGSSGFLGDLGGLAKIAGTIASVIPGGQPVGAALLATGMVNDMTAKQGSVTQPSSVGGQSANPMERRLAELQAPSQLQAPIDPGLEALKRRYGVLG